MRGRNKILSITAIITLLCFSCEEVLEPALNNKQVVLLAPVDNLVSGNASQVFYWETIDGATKYQLQIVSPKFDSIVQLIADTTVPINQFPLNLSKGSYQWKVRAINNSTSSNYSAIRRLVIQ